ncbi:hypothetical protein DOY81_012362 [Sarcophaga bullata]|nr:hypothetical protein DOY81_012362 [Sarcophaga bullata]
MTQQLWGGRFGKNAGKTKMMRYDWIEGLMKFLPSDEDVHTVNERRLTELVGEVGQRLHTGRSRNDQVITI